VEKALAAGDIIALISLDVKGAFDAASWPSILNGLKITTAPKIYLSYPKAILATDPPISRIII
jgi:hypothetical protein